MMTILKIMVSNTKFSVVFVTRWSQFRTLNGSDNNVTLYFLCLFNDQITERLYI